MTQNLKKNHMQKQVLEISANHVARWEQKTKGSTSQNCLKIKICLDEEM